MLAVCVCVYVCALTFNPPSSNFASPRPRQLAVHTAESSSCAFYLDLSCTGSPGTVWALARHLESSQVVLTVQLGPTNFPGHHHQRLVSDRVKLAGTKKQEILQHREQVAQKQAVN